MTPINANDETYAKGKFRGKDVLYTEKRILSASIPKGYYRYEIRHSDQNENKPVELARSIVVNFWGTMITNEPIQLDTRSSLIFRPKDVSYNGAVQKLTDYTSSHAPKEKQIFKLEPLPEEQRFLTYSDSEKDRETGCIGHLRGDFDNGKAFFTTWFDHQENLNKEPFKSEFDKVINWLREEGNPLHSFSDMRIYCQTLGYKGDMKTDRKSYAYGVETEGYRYCFRMIPEHGDYNFYCYCYDKSAAKERSAPEAVKSEEAKTEPVKTKPAKKKEEMSL